MGNLNKFMLIVSKKFNYPTKFHVTDRHPGDRVQLHVRLVGHVAKFQPRWTDFDTTFLKPTKNFHVQNFGENKF